MTVSSGFQLIERNSIEFSSRILCTDFIWNEKIYEKKDHAKTLTTYLK